MSPTFISQSTRTLRSQVPQENSSYRSPSRAGAGRSDRSNYLDTGTRWSDQARIDLHTTGRMYDDVAPTHYNPDLLLHLDRIWFHSAKREAYMVHDCLVHAWNYLCRGVLFADRK